MRQAGNIIHMKRNKRCKQNSYWKHPAEETSYMGPCKRPRHRQEDSIRFDLRKTGWEGVDWIHLAQDRDQWQALVDTIMNLWVP
jgi:hypothetical protein